MQVNWEEVRVASERYNQEQQALQPLALPAEYTANTKENCLLKILTFHTKGIVGGWRN